MPDDWSFSLRSGHYYDSDEDDDERSSSDNTDQNHVALNKETGGIPQAQAELDSLCDFDLSLRKDTAVYKPNPFSIAKINAACRANRPQQLKATPTPSLASLHQRATLPKPSGPLRLQTSASTPTTKGVAGEATRAVRSTSFVRPLTRHDVTGNSSCC